MDEKLKHRVLGSGILGAVGLAFVTWLLSSGPVNSSIDVAEVSDSDGRPAFQSRIVPLEVDRTRSSRENDVLKREKSERIVAFNELASKVPEPTAAQSNADSSARSVSHAPTRPLSVKGTTLRPIGGSQDESATKIGQAQRTTATKARAKPPVVAKAAVDIKPRQNTKRLPAQSTQRAQVTRSPRRISGTGASGAEGLDQWLVQLGTFRSSSNVLSLRKRLKAKGYEVITRSAVEKGNEITRVFVGPAVAKSKARTRAQQLERAISLKGFLVPSSKARG
jgi:cell division septation protein DedD